MLRFALLGSGNVRISVGVIAALATYFGERPLDLRFWDGDVERADLFDRFARLCFTVARSAHELSTVATPEEALEECGRVLIAVDENCASRYFKGRPEAREPDRVERAIECFLLQVPEGTPILDLTGAVSPLRRGVRRSAPWPEQEDERELTARPHQVLRWIHGEEYVNDLLAQHEHTPLKAWLDELEQAETR